MSGPDKVWLDWPQANQGDPAVLAALPEVQAMVAEAREQGIMLAVTWHEERAKDEDALSTKYRGGSNPWFAHVQAAKMHRECAAAIRAGGKP